MSWEEKKIFSYSSTKLIQNKIRFIDWNIRKYMTLKGGHQFGETDTLESFLGKDPKFPRLIIFKITE